MNEFLLGFFLYIFSLFNGENSRCTGGTPEEKSFGAYLPLPWWSIHLLITWWTATNICLPRACESKPFFYKLEKSNGYSSPSYFLAECTLHDRTLLDDCGACARRRSSRPVRRSCIVYARSTAPAPSNYIDECGFPFYLLKIYISLPPLSSLLPRFMVRFQGDASAEAGLLLILGIDGMFSTGSSQVRDTTQQYHWVFQIIGKRMKKERGCTVGGSCHINLGTQSNPDQANLHRHSAEAWHTLLSLATMIPI